MNDAFLAQLEKLLGSAHVVSDPRTLEALAVPGAQPAALCRPGSEEEIAEVVRLAARQGVPLLPCGGWTAMSYGRPAPANALAVSLQRLDRMVAYEPQDLVATAQAGMSFAAFQDALFEHGQELPLDAPRAATLGGLCATGRAGPRRLRHGTLRDMVLGMTVVHGDGVIRRCGGRVVKNVTGYALEKLYLGALGTLGIVTEVTFKLRPLPETASVQEMTADDFETGFEAASELARRLPFGAVTVGFPAKPFSAQFAIEASPPDHARLLREMEAACAGRAGLAFRETGATQADADLWPAVSRRMKAVRLTSGEELVPELCARLTWPMKPAGFPDLMRKVDGQAATAGFGLLMGYLDFPGLVSLELFAAAGEAKAPDLDVLVRVLREAGHAVTVAWKRAEQPLGEPVFGPPRPEWKLMHEIKRAFDPLGILNPGRFVEGI